MDDGGSISRMLTDLKSGGRPEAAQRIWERFFHRLVGLARKRLCHAPRRARDEEDVALSAFDSFYRGAERNRFPRLDDRDDLWQILVMITVRKTADLIEHEGRKKRGAGKVRGESVVLRPDGAAGLDGIADTGPGPETAALFAEQVQMHLSMLDDDVLRTVALRRMEGFTVEEIAGQLGCAGRTVLRKLRRIQSIWGASDPRTPEK